MRFVYATRSAGHFSYVSPVIGPLSAAGHEVQVLFHPDLTRKFADRAELNRLCIAPGQSADWILRRPRASRWVAEGARNLLTYSSYLARKRQSDYYRRRWEQYLPAPARWSLPIPGVRALLARGATKAALRRFEERLAPVPAIVRALEESRPAALIASPLNYWGSEEVEYVKAARKLGIPTALHVFSWDNLTTKSLLYEIPDLVLVWNRKQVEEATEIHGVPRDRILITGSPLFDDLLALDGSGRSREELCAAAGLDPGRPYLAYLGSSSFIASDETWLVRELERALAENPATREVQLLVRPHPAHARIYEALEQSRIRVFPRGGGRMGTPEFTPDFHDTLRHAAAALGINTSGMFNAVVLGKPCLTIISERYRETQSEAMHFQHLLEADVLDPSGDPAGCAATIARLLRGDDERREQRRRFLGDWIRPRGEERAAGELAAAAIEQLARGRTPADIDREICAPGPRPALARQGADR